MKYAVTGSTGKFGQAAIKVLKDTIGSGNIIALARNTDKAKRLFPELEVRPGSYDLKDQLVTSLTGVSRLLLISSIPGQTVSRVQQHQNVINAAKQAGVQFIAYTSFPRANSAASPLAADHRETEQALRQSGINYAFLRNNWYLENERLFFNDALANRPFVYSAGNGRVGWALEREYAEAAAKVLLSDDPKTVYEFSGPQHDYADLGRALQVVSGHQFDITSTSDDELRKRLIAMGMKEPAANRVVSMQQLIRSGDLDEPSGDLADVLGHSLPTFEDSIKEVLAKLQN
ncbi:NAD(P)-dependent oxidoreductase [Lentilactobacillus fungorum]|uniref:NAD(P)-dependent oxidoreductase n=1 Tax=Lentilactobacillus fungorum TaxID=2201250 RepID=A0ABQ3VYA6_9LACO|nr:SDR family oxidoreductase [Lentilactobacillus fungorum]GHP13882.1 NAD(P)-dependent oxidoreductase [Lentilactobacillus fungorum]